MKHRHPRWISALVPCALALSAQAAEPLDEVNRLARDWVRFRTETARLDSSWQAERALMESTIAALQERATTLEEKRDLTKAQTAREREEIDAFVAKNRTAASDLATTDARLRALTARLTALRPQLPPRLSDALALSYRSLANPDLPTSERMQLAINVLNRCAQFNRLVSAGEEVVAIEGEPTPKALEVIYWGLSHGYAIDRRSHKAWLGRPGDKGWRWAPQDDAFDNVVRLVAIARDQADPELIAVPAQVSRTLAAPAAP